MQPGRSRETAALGFSSVKDRPWKSITKSRPRKGRNPPGGGSRILVTPSTMANAARLSDNTDSLWTNVIDAERQTNQKSRYGYGTTEIHHGMQLCRLHRTHNIHTVVGADNVGRVVHHRERRGSSSPLLLHGGVPDVHRAPPVQMPDQEGSLSVHQLFRSDSRALRPARPDVVLFGLLQPDGSPRTVRRHGRHRRRAYPHKLDVSVLLPRSSRVLVRNHRRLHGSIHPHRPGGTRETRGIRPSDIRRDRRCLLHRARSDAHRG